MARRAKAGDAGTTSKTNLSETKEVIRDAMKITLQAKAERKEINATIAEQKARVVNCGVPKAAFDLAIRMKEMDVDDRNAIDEGYAIARDALGMGLQLSMFEAQDPQPKDDEQAGGNVTGIDALKNARQHLGGGDTTADAAA